MCGLTVPAASRQWRADGANGGQQSEQTLAPLASVSRGRQTAKTCGKTEIIRGVCAQSPAELAETLLLWSVALWSQQLKSTCVVRLDEIIVRK